MTRQEAVITLMRERGRDRNSVEGLLRVRRACSALHLSREDTAAVEEYLDYRDHNGRLYPGWETVPDERSVRLLAE